MSSNSNETTKQKHCVVKRDVLWMKILRGMRKYYYRIFTKSSFKKGMYDWQRSKKFEKVIEFS